MAVSIEQQDDCSDPLAVNKRLDHGRAASGVQVRGMPAASGRRWAGTGRVVCGGWVMA